MSDYEGWELGEDGNVKFKPFVGWLTATLPDKRFGVQIRYLSHPGQNMENPDILQLILSENALREFQQDLLNLSKKPHKAKPPTDSKH